MPENDDLHTRVSGEPTAISRRWWVWALAAVLTAALAGGAGFLLADTGSADNPMTTRAEHVMPFDLTATSHTFIKTAAGGVERAWSTTRPTPATGP